MSSDVLDGAIMMILGVLAVAVTLTWTLCAPRRAWYEFATVCVAAVGVAAATPHLL